MIIEILMQAGYSFLIGVMARFKWIFYPFLLLYLIIIGVVVYTGPASILLEGFALWRWFITIPTCILGYYLGGILKNEN